MEPLTASHRAAEKLQFWLERRFRCVHESRNFDSTLEHNCESAAAKRRKNTAHGASRGKSGKQGSPSGAKCNSQAHASSCDTRPRMNNPQLTRIPIGFSSLTIAGFAACEKRGSYQGMPSGIPQLTGIIPALAAGICDKQEKLSHAPAAELPIFSDRGRAATCGFCWQSWRPP